MKFAIHLLLFAAIVLTCFTACLKRNVGKDNVPLIGKWKLNGNYLSSGGPGYWVYPARDDAHYVQFDADGKLEGNEFSNYTSYQDNRDSTLTMYKAGDAAQTYYYIIRHDTLTMSPIKPIVCIEGCLIRFKKD